MGRVILTQINVFPIKSTRGVSLPEARIVERGFQYDRRWMLVDEAGRFVSQREVSKLSQVSVTLEDSGRMRVDAPEMAPLALPLEPDETDRRVLVRIWKDQVTAALAPDEASTWFSSFLGKSCRLVFLPDDVRRQVNPEYAQAGDHVSFADGFPFLLISEGSLAELNAKLTQPVGMGRFRTNLVVSGCEGFAEDGWARIRIGEIEFDVVKPCPRCVVTTVDEHTGLSAKEPLATLARFRTRPGMGALFGQNLIHRAQGRLRVGDEVTVLAAS